MGGGNSGFSRTRGKAAPNPYDLKPGEHRDFQNAFPFGTSKSGKAAVAVVGGVPTLAVLGLIRRKVRSKAALSPDGSTRAPRLMGEDYVYNSRTSGPKRAIYGPPRKPSAPTRPFIEADAPIRSVTASKVSDKTRNAVRNVASDLGRVPRTIFDLNYDPTAPNPKTFPNARANVGKAANAPTPKAPTLTKRYGGGPPAREMTPAQKGQLKKKTNKAAVAAKPIMQQGLRSRFAVPTPKETPAPKAAAKPKAGYKKSKKLTLAAVERMDYDAQQDYLLEHDEDERTFRKDSKKPSSVKVPTPKAPAATTVEIKAPEMTARAFQPGKLEGETRVQTKARHVAEHAADNAAKRAEKKKKVEPKNKTKAPTSAKPPSPAAVEKVSAPPIPRWGEAVTPQEWIGINKSRRAHGVQTQFALRMRNPTPSGMTPGYDEPIRFLFRSPPPVKNQKSQNQRVATVAEFVADRNRSPAAPSPAAVEKVSTPKPSLTAAERKAAKDAKSAENRRVHAENQAREREARRAAKAAGGKASGSGFHNTPQPPPSQTGVFNPNPKPPSSPTGEFGGPRTPPPGEFRSTFKPQVRTFDPMVGQKQYGLKSKPFDDSPEKHRELVKEGMKGRTGKDQRPTHLYDAKGKMVHNVGPFSVEGKKKATSPMFPGGTVSNPRSNQPYMTGKGAKVIGEQGNFRIWQGPRRSETIVEHRTGRQVSLPYNPNKQGPVNPKAILAYANKGNNEKAFMAGGLSADGKNVLGKLGKRNRTARFTLGASKAGGLLAAGGLAAYGIGKLLGPAGTLIGPTNAAAAPSTPGRYYAKQASREPNRAARNSLQRKAVEADRFREGKTASFIEPSKYKSIVKKYGYSPFGNYADVVNTSGAFAKRYPNSRYKAKK